MAYTFKHGDRPLDGYEIQRAVGRGGFGEVYYAVSDGGREVALKYLREHPEVELRLIYRRLNLKSPHLVSIFDVKQNKDGEYFVVMEYISGPVLRDILIAEPNGLGVQKAAFFVREIGKGLAYLHDRGIVHRDLKPGNIFYDEGYAKICDYGLSKFISISRHSAQTTSIGTVHYMAPEVGSGNYSQTIDIYALGVILYEMLLGKVPYEGASMGEILMKHLTQQPEVEQLPQPFARVIRKALAKDPTERYQNVHQIVEDIFEVEDVKQSVMGFEPTSLTMVAARVAEDIRPSPAPSDNPHATTPVDLRRRRLAGSAEGFSKRFVQRTAGLDPRLTKKERRQAKRNKKRRKESRQPPELLGTDHADIAPIRSPYKVRFGRRLARLFAASVVACGLAFAIGLVSEDENLGAISLAIITTSVVGISLGNKVANWLGPDHPVFIGRLLTLAFAAPAAILLYANIGQPDLCGNGIGASVFQHPDRLGHLYIPLLASFALFNWRKRIRSGQSGDFGIGNAVFYGFLTFFGTMILTEQEDAGVWLGAVVGSVSLVLQSFAWAMIRNPLPEATADETAVDEDSRHYRTEPGGASPADGENIARDRQEPRIYAAALKFGDRRLPEGIPACFVRSSALRIAAAVLSFCFAMGTTTLSILLGVEAIRGTDETMCGIVGIVAMSLSFLFWLGTTSRVRRIGLWNEWLNPILRIGAGTALAAGISGLSLFNLKHEELAGFIMLVVMSSLVMLALMIFRQSKRKQLARYQSSDDLDDRDPPGPSAHRQPSNEELHRRAEQLGNEASDSAMPPAAGTGFIVAEHGFIVPAKPILAASPGRPGSKSWWAPLFAVIAVCVMVMVVAMPAGSRSPSHEIVLRAEHAAISHDHDHGVGEEYVFGPSDRVGEIVAIAERNERKPALKRAPSRTWMAVGIIVLCAIVALRSQRQWGRGNKTN